MSERASSGLLPLVLFALILVISAVAVVLGADDANSAGSASASARPTAAGAAVGGVSLRGP